MGSVYLSDQHGCVDFCFHLSKETKLLRTPGMVMIVIDTFDYPLLGSTTAILVWVVVEATLPKPKPYTPLMTTHEPPSEVELMSWI